MIDGQYSLVDNLLKILIISIAFVVGVRFFMFWYYTTNSKMILHKVVAEIEDHADKKGLLEEEYVNKVIDKYKVQLIDEIEVTEVSPKFGEVPGYLGQPMFIELALHYKVAGRERVIKDRATMYNRGHYGGGYNTVNQH